MESSRKDDRLTAALEALRPIPAPAFAAELDERAAGGFPRREGAAATPWASFTAWVRGLTARQVLLPSAVTAFAAVVVATVVVTTSQSGPHSDSNLLGLTNPSGKTPKATAGGAAAAGANAAQGLVTPEAFEAEAEGHLERAPAFSAATPTPATAHRDVERSAQVVLGAEPDAVADDASHVFEAVHAAHGIVLRSSVNEGAEEDVAGAHFELLIPSARLDDALGAISEIDEVLSRRDGTTDITAPTVGATERLQDSQARIDSLLNELAAAETEAERETLEAKLRSERRRAAFLGAELATLRHRASMSHVSVRIEGSSSASGAGGWDIGDATRDAGHILAVAAGVVLIGLAVLTPIALIALLVWAGRHAWVRLERRRALS
jgi:hypothetical protein